MTPLGRFALNMPNACDRWGCGLPLDPEKDPNGKSQLGRWCETCVATYEATPSGRHELRLESAPEGYALCLRCRCLLNANQVMESCPSPKGEAA